MSRLARSTPRAVVLGLGLGALLLAVGALPGAGCTSIDANKTLALDCPTSDADTFRTVSDVLERRCGTLDCHGSTYRPMRIFGQYGLRRPEEPDSENLAAGGYDYKDYYTGGKVPTTQAELDDNAASVCGLEPEKLAAVRAGQLDVKSLTVVRKAILAEKHKGGPIWNEGNPGYRCLVTWLLHKPGDGGSGIDEQACNAEKALP
jgi:hypothetical protein